MNIITQSVKILSPKTHAEATDSLKFVEYAARNCYHSQDKITEKSYEPFIRNLIERGHTAPLEFADVTVELVTSRDVMAELTRHRHASFCIESQRYVDESKNGISFIKPVVFGNGEAPNLYAAWRKHMQESEDAYNYMKENGARNQDARKVLPNSTACVIVMKANLREWLHIIDLRYSSAAYPEMRELARMIYEQLHDLFPCVLR